ncbi:methionyl-tRNA formyltransferase [Chloroflexota bacterium]
MRIVFMGTPSFAVPTLEALADHWPLVGVVTQPDRRAGRGRTLVASPVKEAALERGLALYQPETLRTSEALKRLALWQPDLIVVAAFGQILRKPVLTLPRLGCLNVHASLLPHYRGASPISAVLLAGEAMTGASIMLMDEGMDTGPVLAQTELSIAPDDTTGSLTAKLSQLGAELLSSTLPGWIDGQIVAQPQDDARASYCSPLRKVDGRLDWTQAAEQLARQVRAYDPWPGTYTYWNGKRLNVLGVRSHPQCRAEGSTGNVISFQDGIAVITAQGVLELLEVQLAGRKPMSAGLFARGQRDLVGSRLET